jgi:Flp pilus assembly protein TadG
MRRMMDSPQNGHDDHGVATIFAIIAMVVILIGAGLAIDVGQYVAASRSAQNTADATSLAVAADCAIIGSPTADYSPYRKPGQTINAPACGDGQTTVTATKTVGGLLLKQTAGDVDRSATARWGTLSGATTIPIIIAKCEFDQFPVEGASDIIIHLPDPKKTSGCASGPGGFGQLDSVDLCEVDITAGGTASGKPGNDVFKQIPCLPLPSDLLIPIFDETQCPVGGCQGNDQYPVLGFAVFHLTGYRFLAGGSGSNAGTLAIDTCDDTIGKNCIRGDFIKFTTLDGIPGESEDFGLYQIFLSD